MILHFEALQCIKMTLVFIEVNETAELNRFWRVGGGGEDYPESVIESLDLRN